MTFEKIHKLLYDNKTNFFDSVDDNYLEKLIDQFGIKIYDIFLSAENGFPDINEKISNFIATYRKYFDPNKIDIVPIHLYLMTIFDELEEIALNERNDKLQTVWSEIGDLIVESSSGLNEY